MQKNGLKAVCYEKSDKIGGLVSNFEIDGFRFDNAIHLSFTKDKYVKSIFEKPPYIAHKPDAYCLEKGKWLKHPIQNNLYPLSTEEKIGLIKSFIQRPPINPTTYAEWLEHQYGYAFSKRYPKKYWRCNADELSTTWVGNRVRQSAIDEILRGALEQRDDNHYYANEMRYPKKGGYFEFIRKISTQCDIELNKEAIKINVKSKVVYFSDGTVEKYSDLISSLPLPVIIQLTDNVPDKVKEAAKSLLWTTVDLVSIGFNIKNIPPYLWFYIYDNDNLAARAYSPSWKSEDNAPEGKSSLQFEIYNLSNKKKFDSGFLKNNIKENLLENNICNENDIIFVHHKFLPFGNVVFNHGMEARRNIVLDYLKCINIRTCGRFGEWDYLWSDQSFISGMRAIKL